MADTKPLTPTDAEIDALWVGQQLTVPQLVQRRVIARAALAKLGAPQPVACEPDFWTVCAQYEDGDKTGWVPLPGCSNETEHGVKNLVLQAARKEGYKGTVTGRLQELGWEIRPVYLAPRSPLQQPVAREPLTDEHLRVIERMHVYAHTATLMDFARAIERAHGITTNGRKDGT